MFYFDIFKNNNLTVNNKMLKCKTSSLYKKSLVDIYSGLSNLKWNRIKNRILGGNDLEKAIWLILLEVNDTKNVYIYDDEICLDIKSLYSNLAGTLFNSKELAVLYGNPVEVFVKAFGKEITESILFKELHKNLIDSLDNINNEVFEQLFNRISRFFLSCFDFETDKVSDIKWIVSNELYKFMVSNLYSENLNEKYRSKDNGIDDPYVLLNLIANSVKSINYKTLYQYKSINRNLLVLPIDNGFELGCMIYNFGLFKFKLNDKDVIGIPTVIGSNLYLKLVDNESPLTIQDMMMKGNSVLDKGFIDYLSSNCINIHTANSNNMPNSVFISFDMVDDFDREILHIPAITSLNCPQVFVMQCYMEILNILYTYFNLKEDLFDSINDTLNQYNDLLEYGELTMDDFIAYKISINRFLFTQDDDILSVITLQLGCQYNSKPISILVTYDVSFNNLSYNMLFNEKDLNSEVCKNIYSVCDRIGKIFHLRYKVMEHDVKEFRDKFNSTFEEYINKRSKIYYKGNYEDFKSEVRYYYSDILEDNLRQFEEFKTIDEYKEIALC